MQITTKYIVNNQQGKISLGDGFTVPSFPFGAVGDKSGMFSLDENNLYYCTKDYTGPTILSNGPSHVFGPEPNKQWNYYGGNYLQTGYSQEVGIVPQSGWYIVDDNNTILQILSDPSVYNDGNPTPIANGAGWLMILDGPFTLTGNTVTLYETLPTIVQDPIWKAAPLHSAPYKTYRALLTQTAGLTANNIDGFDGRFIIGEAYKIENYSSGDDFSNIANITGGIINQTGCTFIATGETPNLWTNGSSIVSAGNLVVDELENTLGFPLAWLIAPFGGQGYYVAFNDDLGPKPESFPRTKTFSASVNTGGSDFQPKPLYMTEIESSSMMGVDDIMALTVYDSWNDVYLNNKLYYTSVEIKIYQ